MSEFLPGCEPSADHDRLRKFEADFTPPEVARLCLECAFEEVWREPFFGTARVLDLGAGAGVWSQQVRRTCPIRAKITGIEIREEERSHLERNCDNVLIADFLDPTFEIRPTFDLVVGNPPFSLFREFVERSLAVAAQVWLFAPYDACTRGADAAAWLADQSRHLEKQLIIPGALKFRNGENPKTKKPYTTDFRTYALWCFSAFKDEEGWQCDILEMLPSQDRKWVVRPGTEGAP